MWLDTAETLALHHQDHAERMRTADRDRTARHLERVLRARRWAGRLQWLSDRLDRAARAQRARLS